MLDEPSILDYLKSKLKFWERGGKIDIPAEAVSPKGIYESSSAVKMKPAVPANEIVASDEASQVSAEAVPSATELENPELPPKPFPTAATLGGISVQVPKPDVPEPILKPVKPTPVAQAPSEKPAVRNRWPWRSLPALVFALLAQRAWEPAPNRTALAGLILYAISFGFLIWAYFAHEWDLSPKPETTSRAETMLVRRIPLILGFLLTMAAFITTGHNLFTVWNVELWLLAILCFIWTFWLPGRNLPSFWQRTKTFLTQDTWQIKITKWALVILVVAALVSFFRLYNLNGVPLQPNSDHAEKILDVFDVSRGQTHIFFPRDGGREGIQVYLILLVSWVFGTGLSFLSLKISTVICGLATLPYLYLLGKEMGGKRIGLLAVFFAGIAYWPNVISRFGLDFPLYPLFVAPTLYYLLRGLRTRNRNDFILSGLFLGFGLYGYTPFRIVPFVVVIGIFLYLLHDQSKGNRKQAVVWLVVTILFAFVVFVPLMRYWMDNPSSFATRVFSRLGSKDAPLPGPAWEIFLSNTWNALRMFNWNDGNLVTTSVVYRSALDVVSGALFILGCALLLIRYIRKRYWLDLFLLLAIPLLELPSILSIAFPQENPIFPFTSGALVPVFLIIAMALDGLITGIMSRMNSKLGLGLAWVVILFLAFCATLQNYDLVFHQYSDQYIASTWNSSEMGKVVTQFNQVYGTTDRVWVVAYPYWVDTRLLGVWVGIPYRDFAIWPQDFNKTLDIKGAKLFMLKPEDTQDIDTLRQLYPQSTLSTFHSAAEAEGKDFMILFVPSNG